MQQDASLIEVYTEPAALDVNTDQLSFFSYNTNRPGQIRSKVVHTVG